MRIMEWNVLLTFTLFTYLGIVDFILKTVCYVKIMAIGLYLHNIFLSLYSLRVNCSIKLLQTRERFCYCVCTKMLSIM